MTSGITFQAFIPVRKDPSDQSEMTSQLLFGETFDLMDRGPGSWIRVMNHFDRYEGWICYHSSGLMDDRDMKTMEQCQPNVLNRRFAILKPVKSSEEMVISAGSTIYHDPMDANRIFAGQWFRLDHPVKPVSGDVHENLENLAGEFLNSPYLWGGKSAFGTDCSGLVQTLLRIMGIPVKRDTSAQCREGNTVNMLSGSRPGDLVFFDDEEGKIIHVGILLDSDRVLHASGLVRIDPIDHQGIYNESLGSYTHKLRLIKRVFNEKTK